MTHALIDRCKETTSTTGTGNLTLTGAATGFVSVASGLTTNGDTSWFCAEFGTEWEEFLGTRVDATHLARTTVLASSNAGALVNFSSPPVVFSTVPGAKIATNGPQFSAYRGSTNQSISSFAWTKVQLNAELFDTESCFDSSTNYRFQPNVPGYYQISAGVFVQAASGLGQVSAAIYKNGSIAAQGGYYASATASYSSSPVSKLIYLNGSSDYVELYVYAAGTTLTANFGDSLTFMTGSMTQRTG